jgi:soluble cytochrome b562
MRVQKVDALSKRKERRMGRIYTIDEIRQWSEEGEVTNAKIVLALLDLIESLSDYDNQTIEVLGR